MKIWITLLFCLLAVSANAEDCKLQINGFQDDDNFNYLAFVRGDSIVVEASSWADCYTMAIDHISRQKKTVTFKYTSRWQKLTGGYDLITYHLYTKWTWGKQDGAVSRYTQEAYKEPAIDDQRVFKNDDGELYKIICSHGWMDCRY